MFFTPRNRYRLAGVLFHLAIFFLLGLHKITPLRPQSVHQWRQCDGASYALNYHQQHDNFFFPRTMTYLGHGGHTVSEFPIVYYITGKLYDVFGFQEGIARLVSYAFLLLGLIGLFELGLRLFQRPVWAFIPPLLLYASPVIPYYALNFLPNVPGLALSLASFYFIYRFWENGRLRDFIWFSLLSALASLLKPVEIFNFGVVVAILFAVRINLFRFETQKAFITQHQRKLLQWVACVLGINVLWIYYVIGYNDSFGNHLNLIGVLPVWKMTIQEIKETINNFTVVWAYQLVWTWMYLIFSGISVATFILKKYIHPLVYWLHAGAWVMQILYVLLFFKTFAHHDYYLINLWVLPALSSLAVFQALSKLRPWPARTEWAAFAVIVALIAAFPLRHSRHILHERYFGSLNGGVNPHLQTITPYLRSIGIKPDDIVVSVPDPSPSVSLYLMNQMGWTESSTGPGYDLNYFRDHGAKYLIVNGPITSYVEWYGPYLAKAPIGDYHGIKIYSLH